MPTKTNISWADFSSNPLRYRDAAGRDVWACVKISSGCANCYSATLAKRWGRGSDFNAGEMARLTPYLDEREMDRLRTSKALSGKRVFLADMTDIFGEWVPELIIAELFAVVSLRRDVTFQVLTKRPQRMREDVARLWPLPNCWFGTSVENLAAAGERIPHLLATPAATIFLSCEPLLGAIDLHLEEWREADRRNRGVRLPISPIGRIADRSERISVESGGGARESVEPSSETRARDTPQDRRDKIEGIPPGQSNATSQASDGGGAAPRMAAFQRPYPTRDDDQSHQRDQGRQSTDESRTRDILGTATACTARSDARAYRPERRAERHGEANDAGCGRYTQLTGTGMEASADSRSVWRGLQGDLENLFGPTLAKRFWIIAGGESGPSHRSMEIAWLEDLAAQCRAWRIPLYVKQDSGFRPGQQGRIPDALWAVKQFPEVMMS